MGLLLKGSFILVVSALLFCSVVFGIATREIRITDRVLDSCSPILVGKAQVTYEPPIAVKYIGDDQKIVMVQTGLGGLFRSVNEGISWTNVGSTLERGSEIIVGRGSGVRGIYPLGNGQNVILTSHSDFIWYSSDFGAKFKLVSVSGSNGFYTIKPHPFDKKTALGMSIRASCYIAGSTEDCHTILFLTKDAGASWKQIATYVIDASWGDAGLGKVPNSTLYISIYNEKSGNQYKKDRYDCKFFRANIDSFPGSLKELVDHGVGFIFYKNQYLFVAQVQAKGSTTALNLLSSTDSGASFRKAMFPKNEHVAENRYTILDASEKTALVNVDHSDGMWGHLYDSDSSAKEFSISLRYNKRERTGHCDFSRVNGIEGVFIANVLQNPDVSQSADFEIKSFITFDKGGEWRPLSFPEGEKCSTPGKCQFHVAVTHKTLAQDLMHPEPYIGGALYSKNNAVGLIMASGTIGNYLMPHLDDMSTYLSRDAGLTWTKIKDDLYVYDFADHGALIVMGLYDVESNSIVYSWDQGLTWNECSISKNDLYIQDIISKPSATGQTFVVIADELTDDGEWNSVIIGLDFSGLHERQCKGYDSPDTPESDYETFSLSDSLGGECLLGHRSKVVRRKREAACYNGQEFERIEVVQNCPCSEEDWECDFGYERIPGSTECQKTSDVSLPSKQEQCKNNKNFVEYSGYRLVPGNTCVGGIQKGAKTKPCSEGESSGHGMRIAGTLFVSASLIAFVGYGLKRSRAWERDWSRLPFGSSRANGYSWTDISLDRSANVRLVSSDGVDDEEM